MIALSEVLLVFTDFFLVDLPGDTTTPSFAPLPELEPPPVEELIPPAVEALPLPDPLVDPLPEA